MEDEKNVTEKLKNFSFNTLYKKGLYIDILYQEIWRQGFITEVKPNNKYNIIFLSSHNQTSTKNDEDGKSLTFFGENYYQSNYNYRDTFLNVELGQIDSDKLYQIFTIKLGQININLLSNNIDDNTSPPTNDNSNSSFDYIVKDNNNNLIDLSGYYTYQFMSGFLVDCIVFINSKLLFPLTEIDSNFKQLIILTLDTIIYMFNIIKDNLENLRGAVFNRRGLLINKINAILASFEIVLTNIYLLFLYNFSECKAVFSKFIIVYNLCYEILIKSKNNNEIPIQLLVLLINFVTSDEIRNYITNYDKIEVYKIFLSNLENIKENEIKYIKNCLTMKNYCCTVIQKIFGQENETLINRCYYSFLINCLKCNNLEKKMNALTSINEILIKLSCEKEINEIFYEFFINKKKILDIFFEETAHEEIVSRSVDLFIYLVNYNKLSDGIIDKLIQIQSKNSVKKILCEIIKKNPGNTKKKNLFQKITCGVKIDQTNIDYISKLTLACLSTSTNNNSSQLNKININKKENFTKLLMDKSRRKSNSSINSIFKKKAVINLTTNNNNNNNNNKLSRNVSYYENILRHNKSNEINNNNSNYYGLDILFDYIISSNDNKQNITHAINSFYLIINKSQIFGLKDICYFMDKLLENIRTNKKFNSVNQSLILAEKLLYILFEREMQNDNNENNNNNLNNTIEDDRDFAEEEELIKALDVKFDVISLLTNDLLRYLDNIPKNLTEIDSAKIFEGIYTHYENIEERVKIIFLFSCYGLNISWENHIEKIFKALKPNKFKKDRLYFFKELSKNIDYIDNEELTKLMSSIIQNKNDYDFITFSEKEILSLIEELFIKVNIISDAFVNDQKKSIRVVKKDIEGLDLIFEILTKNNNAKIKKEISNLLCHICLFLFDYTSNDFSSKYWKFYFEKITDLLKNCHERGDQLGLRGLVQLIDNIYTRCINFVGKIPVKEDTHVAKEPFVLYHFCCPEKDNKEYRLRVGKVDKIIHMRWKLGYYYDLHINDLVLIDDKKKVYNFVDDQKNFYDIFPPQKYATKDKFILINVSEIKGQLLTIKNNPKELIENNKIIFDVLIDNLYIQNEKENNNNNNSSNSNDKDNNDTRTKIWKIIGKFPKKIYIDKHIKKYGDSSYSFKPNELKKIFNKNEKYILTFTLQCILNHLKNEENKNSVKFCDAFINVHHIDKLLYTVLLDINVSNTNQDQNKNQNQLITFECLIAILDILNIIESFKQKKGSIDFSEFIPTKRQDIKFKTLISNNARYNNNDNLSNFNSEIDETKIQNFNTIIPKDSITSVFGGNKIFDKFSEFITNILEIKDEYLLPKDYNATESKSNKKDNPENEINLILADLLKKIIFFIEKLSDTTNNINNYFQYILSNEESFKKIFIYDFINCQKEELKQILSDYLYQNLFGMKNTSSISTTYEGGEIKAKLNNNKDNNNNIIFKTNANNKPRIKTYFDVTLTPEVFNYLVENDKQGIYFIILNNIMKKYIKEDNQTFESIDTNHQYLKQFKQIIDSIIKYFDNECEYKKNNIDYLSYPFNSNEKEGGEDFEKEKKLKDSKLTGIVLFLGMLLINYSSQLIPYFIEKVDICDIFLNKCILRKCNENPLETNEMLCQSVDSRGAVFSLIIFILQKSKGPARIELFTKIWQILDIYHKMGFWKTNKSKDWEIKCQDFSKSKFIGLKNMSATCYMNSILQQLFMIPMLRETILSIAVPKDNHKNATNILYQLQILFSSLKTYEYQYYDPKQFVLSSKLSFYEQMDADEYYGQLIDQIESDINKIYSTGAGAGEQQNKNPYKDLLKFFFGIKVIDELNFVECGHKRYNEFFYNNIQLEVKGFSNIIDSLQSYCKTEIMSGENKINCEQCKTKRICHKRQLLKSLPNVLVIALKRFEFNYRSMMKYKLNNYFEFPFELDMKDYLVENNNETNTIYILTGITIHFGVSDSGHYYDLIKGQDDKWYMFNDTVVSEFPSEDIPKEAFGDQILDDEIIKDSGQKEKDKKNAYILIYTKKNFERGPIENLMNNFETKLALPPFNKMSNISPNLKMKINYEMFKSWTLESITNEEYQNFIIELLKLDMIKHAKNNLEKEHSKLFDELKDDGYFPITPDKYIENKDNSYTIFEYGIRYFFNIMLRIPKDKENIYIYEEILKVYLENDEDKCKYILEEFSDNDIINEFLVYCPIQESILNAMDIISFAFKFYFLSSDDKEFLIQFINSLLLYISIEINNISIEFVIQLFSALVNSNKIFKDYLKEKGIEKWIRLTISNNNKEGENGDNGGDNGDIVNTNLILSENMFPKIKSRHLILNEKIMAFNFGGAIKNSNEFNNNEVRQSVNKKLKNTSINFAKIKEFENDLK